MAAGQKVDVEYLHRYLFEQTDRLGRLKLKQVDIAERLGITKFTMSRTITKFIEQGRVRLLTKNRNNRGTYVITDPDEWHQAFDDQDD